jgi:hypothetical protein
VWRSRCVPRIIQHGRRVHQADRVGKIVEVRGEEGPFLVRFEGRDPRLVFPGPDTEVAAANEHYR